MRRAYFEKVEELLNAHGEETALSLVKELHDKEVEKLVGRFREEDAFNKKLLELELSAAVLESKVNL